MAYDTTTQALIDKVKRLASTSEADTVIVLRIGDAFDSIKTDTDTTLAFEDESTYTITPDISGTSFGALREAIVYCVLSAYLEKTLQQTAGKSVRVKSGRDEVDTTSGLRGYTDALKTTQNRYKKAVNQYNLKTAWEEIIIEKEDE